LYAQGFGGTGLIDLRSNAANSLATIGTASGPVTNVILQGAGSVIRVTPFFGGAPVTIDQTLRAVAGSGVFSLDDRNFTVVANGGNFSNAGLTFVNNSVFTATSFTNSGVLIADRTSSVVAPISNSGTVRVASGTLTSQAITGTSGTITTESGATLALGGTSTAGTLNNNGSLALGTNNITVSNDYTNANFGTGNAFNGRSNVTGSGLILASSATQDLSGPALTGNTLNVGNVRTGGSSSTTLTITNNGTETTLRGAVQNGSAPSVALSGADFVLNPNGGNATVTISYTGLAAGSLAGQSLNVVNNFDNVASSTVNLAGNIYQVAQAGAVPASVALAARRVGDGAASTTLTIANVAPVTPGFNEALRAEASAGGGFLLNGSGNATVNNLAAGNSSSITLSRGTGTAGSFTGTVSIANTSLAVPGSGLADLTLAGQSIAVSNNVYALAVANVSPTTVNFGTVRQGATSPTGSVGITNGATGALTDELLTTVGATPANIIAGPAPGALAAGASGAVNFSLNTGLAGNVSGSTTLGFASHNSELADLVLGSETVNFTGTVTDLAVASIFKNAGAGAFSGGGTSYSYDLGTLTADSGSFSTDFGVANIVALSSFSESLGGSFSDAAVTGYSFAGNSFAGLQGGSSNLGNLLVFDTAGLSDGTYSKTLTFNGFSAYSGLANQNLSPISINIVARITGGAPGAVPEPGTWVMMILGFGLIGAASRRTKRAGAGLVTIG
ncbi:MAG: choice-of-anchor D domain-containing protein, partial [Sphingomonas sp.]|nr:choice-of-anchor D domain-containing protein [Sphingomonas sp.]